LWSGSPAQGQLLKSGFFVLIRENPCHPWFVLRIAGATGVWQCDSGFRLAGPIVCHWLRQSAGLPSISGVLRDWKDAVAAGSGFNDAVPDILKRL
jgi:hypothetical protein